MRHTMEPKPLSESAGNLYPPRPHADSARTWDASQHQQLFNPQKHDPVSSTAQAQKPAPKHSGDYALASSTSSYATSVVSSDFTLSSSTTGGSSAPCHHLSSTTTSPAKKSFYLVHRLAFSFLLYSAPRRTFSQSSATTSPRISRTTTVPTIAWSSLAPVGLTMLNSSRLRKSFSTLPISLSPFPLGCKAHQKPDFVGSDVRIRNDDIPTAHIAVAIEGVSWSSPDYYPMLIMRSIFGNWDHMLSSASLLSSHLSDTIAKHNLTNSYMSFSTSYLDTGLWEIYLVTGNLANLDDLLHFTLREWTHMSIAPTTGKVEQRASSRRACCLEETRRELTTTATTTTTKTMKTATTAMK
jgi:hypothetical protein